MLTARFQAVLLLALWLLGTTESARSQSLTRPGFQLESTVGFDSQSCATDRSLALPPGSHDVIVCLRAINGSRQEYVLHDLLNEQLGVLATDLHYTLNAGSDVYYTFPLTVNESVGVTSAWLARGLNGEFACKIAWSVITVGGPLLTAADSGPALVCP